MKYAELAQKIVDFLGGKSNIRQVTHCATRLRFIVKDEAIINEEAIKQLSGVLELNKRMGEIQVVIGNEVQSVFYAVNQIVGEHKESSEKVQKRETLSPWLLIRLQEFLLQFYQHCAAVQCYRLYWLCLPRSTG